jgi:polyisoprenoid-binding protein YceI
MKIKYILYFLIFFTSTTKAQKYTPLDQGSKVHFVIKNFGIKTGGQLIGLKGDIYFFTSDLAACRFNVSVRSSTIDTDNGSRDKHLKGEEYFDVEKFPEIKIESTKLEKTNKTVDGYYFLSANLTIHGITKAISFPFHAEKQNDSYLFTGEFEINRLDFGVGKNSAVLSNTVAVSISVLAKKN